MALIKILMAVYNGGKYIEKQIESILNQSFNDFTIKISDDGSDDNTADIAELYMKRCPGKIEFVKRQAHVKGAGENFFSLLDEAALYNNSYDICGRQEASCGYIMLSDQDDVWLPDKIKKTYMRMRPLEKRYSKNMPCLVHTNLSTVDENLNIIHRDMASYMNMNPGCCRLNRLLTENNVTGNTIMINRAFLKAYRRPQEYVMHDWWLALTASCIGKTSYIDEPLVLYRQHGKNLLGAKNALSAEVIKNRIKDKEQVRQNYRLMYAQASELLKNYKITGNKKILIDEFIKLQYKSRPQKIVSIIRNRFFKNTAIMTLGEMLNI